MCLHICANGNKFYSILLFIWSSLIQNLKHLQQLTSAGLVSTKQRAFQAQLEIFLNLKNKQQKSKQIYS